MLSSLNREGWGSYGGDVEALYSGMLDGTVWRLDYGGTLGSHELRYVGQPVSYRLMFDSLAVTL